MDVRQRLLAQYLGGDGVDNEVVAEQQAVEMGEMHTAEDQSVGQGQLVILSGGYAHPGAQGLEALGGQPSHPPKADNQNLGAVDGNGQMLHSQLDGSFRCGERISDGTQFLHNQTLSR